MPTVKLRRLHEGQKNVRRRSKRFNTLRCGRRFGKTEYGKCRLMVAPKGIIAGYPVAWFAPTYKYLAEVWRELAHDLEPAIASKDKQNKVIYLRNGARIDFWTLDDPDAGRGRKYGHVVIDEAAKVRYLKDAWNQAIRPTLTDFKGGADIMSTPKGRDAFAEFCMRGEIDPRTGNAVLTDPKTGLALFQDWATFHLPTAANPYIDADEIEAARLELPDLVFRQEYLAEFVDFSGTVVKREWLRWGDPLEKWKEEQLVTCIGGDLASSLKTHADYTAAVVLSKDPDGYFWIRWVERGRMTFRDTIRFFAELAATWKARTVMIEQVAYQSAAVQELLATTNFNIRGYEPPTGGGDKKDKFTRFLPVQARFQRGMVLMAEQLPAYFEGELLSFTGTKDDDHDDMVDALGFAYFACNDAQMDQTEAGGGARVSVAGAVVSESDGIGSVRIVMRR